jgi:hypothetical protein
MPLLPLVVLCDMECVALNGAIRATKRVRDGRQLQAIHLLDGKKTDLPQTPISRLINGRKTFPPRGTSDLQR